MANWIRLITFSAIVFAITCVFAGMALGWQYLSFMPWNMVLLAPFMLATYLVCSVPVICAMPNKIDIRAHKHILMQGSSASIIRSGNVARYRIDFFDLMAISRLTITGKTTRNRTVTRRFWIRNTVNQSDLITLLNTLTAQDTALPQHLRA